MLLVELGGDGGGGGVVVARGWPPIPNFPTGRLLTPCGFQLHL